MNTRAIHACAAALAFSSQSLFLTVYASEKPTEPAGNENLCAAMQSLALQKVGLGEISKIESVTAADFGRLQWPRGKPQHTNSWIPVSLFEVDINNDGTPETLAAVTGSLGGARAVDLYVQTDAAKADTPKFNYSQIKEACKSSVEVCFEPIIPREAYRKIATSNGGVRLNTMLISFEGKTYAGIFSGPPNKIRILEFNRSLVPREICQFSIESKHPNQDHSDGDAE